jgi:hypothetical protein
LTENLLKWLLFISKAWDKCASEKTQELVDKEIEEVRAFCKRLNFYSVLHIAFLTDVLDYDLYRKIDAVRKERNDLIHQLWIFSHRHDSSALRRKLGELAEVVSELVGIFNQLIKEIGVDGVDEMFL